jgi:hypothetical protein
MTSTHYCHSHLPLSPPFNHLILYCITGAVVVKERDRNGKFYILNDGNAQMLKANKATGEKVAGEKIFYQLIILNFI